MTKRAVRDLKPSDILSRREIDETCLRPENLRDRALLCLFYLTAGRVSEVLEFRKSQFRVGERDGVKYLVIQNAPVGKRRDYMVRNVPVPWTDKLRPTITEYLANLGDEDKLFDFTRQRAWQITTENEAETWCHWWRAQRISHLINEREMGIEQVQEFIKCKDIRSLEPYRHTGWYHYAEKLVEPEVRR